MLPERRGVSSSPSTSPLPSTCSPSASNAPTLPPGEGAGAGAQLLLFREQIAIATLYDKPSSLAFELFVKVAL